MAHVRKQIRDAVVKLLKASSPSNWRYVYNSRQPLQREVRPYLLVYIETEEDEDATIHPATLIDRNMTLSIVANVDILKNPETFENTLDSIAADIENRITFTTLNAQLTGAVKGLFLLGSNSQIVTDETERTYGEIALSYRVQVMTQGDPETLS